MSQLMTRKGYILSVLFNASLSNDTAMKTGLDIVFAINKKFPQLAQSPKIMPITSALSNLLRKRLTVERESGVLTP